MRAFVTGASRGIGADIARALAADGHELTIAARGADALDEVAAEIGATAVVLDVTDRAAVENAIHDAGPLDLLVANAGVTEGHDPGPSYEIDVDAWWNVYEVNVLGVHLCCRAAIPAMLGNDGATSRIVITGSGAAYLPGGDSTAYAPSKAAVCRYGEMLANELRDRIPVFHFSPGLVRTELTIGGIPDDAPWTPPELAPEMVRKLATGRYDALAGRYLHAEHDDLDDLMSRLGEIEERDLNAIRLRR